MPAVVGSVAGAILSVLGKGVGFFAEHTWGLIAFIAGLIGWWLKQRVQNYALDIDLFMISFKVIKN